MRKTFRFRLFPTIGQAQTLDTWLMLCRRLYNACLEQRIAAWMKQKSVNYYDQAKELPALKQALPEYKTVDAQALQNVVSRVERAFQAFFRRCGQGAARKGFPKFQGRDRYSSITLSQTGWKVREGHLSLSRCGAIKVKWHRPLQGVIKTVTVKRTKTDKWFVCFSCDNVPAQSYPEPIRQAVGIDLGLSALAYPSEGEPFRNAQHLKNRLRYLRRLQRRLARQQEPSHRRRKTRRQVARLHERVANQRRDAHHKASSVLVRENAVVVHEDISPRFMLENHRLARAASDVGWHLFLTILHSKAAQAGRTVIAVDPRNTSQTCSSCGHVVPKELSMRVHECPHCGFRTDRDHNAALNILRRGLDSLRARTEPSDAKPGVA